MLKSALCVLLICLLVPVAFSEGDSAPDYSDKSNWVYYESYEDRNIDIFFMYPTMYSGSEGAYNASLEESKANKNYRHYTKQHKYIYDYKARFFAPFYRQTSFETYLMSDEDRKQYLNIAAADAINAFEYYINNINGDRPFILAGYSQGAEMCMEILKKYGADERVKDKLIAAYIIGWRLTRQDVETYPFLLPATCEDDTGVIICMECEAPFVEESTTVPKGVFTYSINPLNWKTDSTPADKSLNKGACFFDTLGNIKEIKYRFCGSRIDPERGTVIVDDVSPDIYGKENGLMPYGSYHIYSHQFFCNNLKENVVTRVEKYKADRKASQAVAN